MLGKMVGFANQPQWHEQLLAGFFLTRFLFKPCFTFLDYFRENKLVIVILYKTATNNSDKSSQKTCSIDRRTHVFIPENQSTLEEL